MMHDVLYLTSNPPSDANLYTLEKIRIGILFREECWPDSWRGRSRHSFAYNRGASARAKRIHGIIPSQVSQHVAMASYSPLGSIDLTCVTKYCQSLS